MGFVVSVFGSAALAPTCGVRSALQANSTGVRIGECLQEIVRVTIIRRLDALARDHTERAVETITSIMDDCFAEDRDRLAAGNAILDRGHGKPLVATIALPASRRAAAELAAMGDEELELLVQGTELPRLTKATMIEHHQPAFAVERDPLLD